MKDVYPGETGKGVIFHLKPLSPLIYSIRIAGYWVENYEMRDFQLQNFQFLKKPKQKGKTSFIF
jgi:hypothetical protein